MTFLIKEAVVWGYGESHADPGDVIVSRVPQSCAYNAGRM